MPQANNPQSVASSPASEGLTSALNKQDSPPLDKSKLTTTAEPCLPTDSHTPNNIAISEPVQESLPQPTSLSEGFPAKTCQPLEKDGGYQASAQDYSSTPSTSSNLYNLAGWSLKMSRGCSLAMLAKTSRQSSPRLPNAGIWGTGECLMLGISESPQNAVEYSWSQVIDSAHPLSLWLTVDQIITYQARLARAGKMPTLLCLQGLQTDVLISREPISALSEADGVRWLSGPERLKMMGFAKDWMRPTLQRLGLRVMPSVRQPHAGLHKN